MIIKKKKENPYKEFTDEDGKKWFQTSPDDLFEVKELNDIIKSINTDRSGDDIVLAHIDFKKVNREYYETLKQMQGDLKKKDLLMKKLIAQTKVLMNRKNSKLNELIDYIKKLHAVIAHYQSGGSGKSIEFMSPVYQPVMQPEDEVETAYDDATEYFLDENGSEIK